MPGKKKDLQQTAWDLQINDRLQNERAKGLNILHESEQLKMIFASMFMQSFVIKVRMHYIHIIEKNSSVSKNT